MRTITGNVMPNLSDLDYLNEEDRATIAQTFLLKLAEAQQSVSILEQQALAIKEDIKRWQAFLGNVEPVQAGLVDISQDQEGQKQVNQFYDKGWSQQKKALYAISNPQIIGKNSVAGGLDVLRVLHELDPEFIPSVEPQPLRRKFTNLVSTLAWEGKLIKLREKQNKGIVHYIPPEWFENGSLKPQYMHLLEVLELIPPKKKAPAKAEAKKSLTVRSSE